MSKEHEAMAIKYAHSKMMVSVILEGPAIGYISDKKKVAGRSGSRGKYLSHCVVFYETNIERVKALEKQIRAKEIELMDAVDPVDAFIFETRIQHLEKLLRENGIIY